MIAGQQTIAAPELMSGEARDVGQVLHGWTRTLKRHRTFLIVVTVLGAVLFYGIASIVPPRYRAHAVVSVTHDGNTAIDPKDGQAPPIPDLAETETLTQMFYSPALGERVIDEQGLRNDPEFSGREDGLMRAVSTASDWIGSRIGALTGEPVAPANAAAGGDPVLRSFFEHLHVSAIDRSFAITVEFRADSARKATDIANAVARTFVQMQTETKRQRASDTTAWLDQWLADAKSRVATAEEAVEDYRNQAGLTSVKNEPLASSQLGDLSNQLVTARVARMEAEAQLEQLNRAEKSKSIDSLPDILNSQLIQTLRAKETDLLGKQADLAGQYGPKYPAVMNVTHQLADVRDKIQVEIGKIAESLRDKVAIAKLREDQLSQTVTAAEQKSGVLSKDAIHLRELQSEADAGRTLYDNVLSRAVEMRLNEERATANSEVAASAIQPNAPYFPKKLPASLVGALGFCLLGVAGVQLREKMERGFNSSDEVQRATGRPLIALVPLIPEIGDNRTTPDRYRDPFFREALSGMHTSLLMQRGSNNLLLVTSSVPGEGKTFLATSMALQMARSGRRCLLLDCDFRLPRAHSALGLEGEVGLLQLLKGEAEAQSLIQKHSSGLHFIASGASAIENGSPSEDLAEVLPVLLASPSMRSILSALAEQYDVLVVDSPPVLGTSDARILAALAGRVIYVVRWRDTARETVLSGLQRIAEAAATPISLALSQIDPKVYADGNGSDADLYARKYRRYLERV
jgi:uncharacterized protein involved in exopolysaccharide biosynthesis